MRVLRTLSKKLLPAIYRLFPSMLATWPRELKSSKVVTPYPTNRPLLRKLQRRYWSVESVFPAVMPRSMSFRSQRSQGEYDLCTIGFFREAAGGEKLARGARMPIVVP